MSEILKRIFGNGSEQEHDEGNGVTVIDRPVEKAPPQLAPEDATNTAKPPMYAVMLNNDDTTDPNFVVNVLRDVFNINEQKAIGIMLTAHRSGKAVVVVCSKEVAETKLEQAKDKIAKDGKDGNAMKPGQPCELTFSIEPESDGGE